MINRLWAEDLGVLVSEIIEHATSIESTDNVAENAMAIEDSKNLVVSIGYCEKVVLILLMRGDSALLARELNVFFIIQPLLVLVEVFQQSLLLQQRLVIVEHYLVLRMGYSFG